MSNLPNIPLKELVLEAQSGFASGKRDEGGIAQIRMNNVTTSGELDLTAIRRVPNDATRNLERYLLNTGDVLFNSTNSPNLVGKTALFIEQDEPYVFSNHFVRLVADPKRLDSSYLARWLTRQQQRGVFELLCTRWVNQAAVRRDDLLTQKIPLPPLDEQRHIAAILDKADELRQKRRHSLACLDDLLKSVFLEMFGNPVTNPMGWDIKTFGDVCDSHLGKMLDAKQQTGKHLRLYLRNANVQWNRLWLDDIAEMDFDERDRRKYRLHYGDLLICEGGEVGRTAIWRNQLDECYFQKALHRARVNPDLALPEYILFFMWFMANYQGLRDHTTSVTIAHLTGVKLKRIPVPLPPIALQKSFVTIHTKIEDLRNTLSRSEKKLDTLFLSLQQRAFRGEL